MDSNSLQRITAKADQLYAGRQDIANVLQSLELLSHAGTGCFETAWRLSRVHFFLGQESPNRYEALRFHAAGVKAGRRAKKLRSDRVEGYFWLGVNLALLARLASPSKAVAPVLKAKAALQKAITIDAAYHSAGPLRVLARLQYQLPRLLGGGVTAARANFERALGIAPANTVTRIYFAELLNSVGETTRARAELEYVLNAPLDPDWAFEIQRDQGLAKGMLGNYFDLEESQG